MTTRTVPPFRADHSGSLLRSPELTGAREEHSALTVVGTDAEVWG